MEPISIGIGITAAKLMLRMWTGGSLVEAAGDDMVGMLGTRVQGRFAERAVKRQLDDLADHIASRLEPFLSQEVAGISNNELEAAARAAQESLDRANATDPSVLLSVDLDSAQLTRLIQRADPRASERLGLGQAASGVYDTLISECASYVTSVANQLPGYSSREAQELLGRNSRLAEIAQQILSALPISEVPSEWGTGSDDKRFENKYRHSVREYAEQLQLFGVTHNDARRAYPLSVAYISMAVDDQSPTNHSCRDIEGAGAQGEADKPDQASDSLRVEALLDGVDRLLLTGGAGSGKTTLIQWIALLAVSDASAANAPIAWMQRVPFIIQLRRFVGVTLPTPGSFVEQIAPNLVDAMPKAWVHRVLASGRASVLIDGLDEIPEAERETARQWLLGLTRDFPDNKYLVTSRSTAVTGSWLESDAFHRAELLPMEYPDIRAFVAHWHEATRQAVDASRQADVDLAEKSLLGIIRERAQIRALCTSPLLCALICALHLQNGSSLPTNRMDVYRIALEMLVHNRDNDRRVRIAPTEIELPARQVILRDFAVWMHENGLADATRDQFEQRVERSVSQLHRVNGESSDVAAFMLERSGVLREPVAGRVDFVHRTFLEYLAAAAIVDDNSIDKLVKQANDDHWREVIILAAGHSNSEQRVRLLEGILQRGREAPRRRHRLYLLAVACMETSQQLPTELQKDLEAALREVLPPKNMTEATAVASAGELAVPLLESFSRRGAAVAAACVRSLSLIGGDAALRALAAYRHDHRVTVTRQLIRAWSSFDTATYARDVLADSSLDDGFITVRDADQLAQLPELHHVQRAFVSFPRRVASVWDLPTFSSRVSGVEFVGLDDVRTPAALPFPKGILSLTVRASSLETLDGIEQFEDLRYLSVPSSRRLASIGAASSLPHLRYLDISGSIVEDLGVAGSLSLEGVHFYAAQNLRAISSPVDSVQLYISMATRLGDTSGLAESRRLKLLSLGFGGAIDLELPPNLDTAYLNSWRGQARLSGGESLETLTLHTALDSDSFEWLVTLPRIRDLSVAIFDGKIAGMPVEVALAEIGSRTGAHSVSVAAPYEESASLPDIQGWSRFEGGPYAHYSRSSVA